MGEVRTLTVGYYRYRTSGAGKAALVRKTLPRTGVSCNSFVRPART
jgi:hypothetical protein